MPTKIPKFYCWFISMWVCMPTGAWGFHSCVYRQKNPLLNIHDFQALYKEHYLKTQGVKADFVVTHYNKISYEEFCYNGEIAVTKPGDEPQKSE